MLKRHKKMVLNMSLALCLAFGGVGSVYAIGDTNADTDVVYEYKVANGLDGLGSSGQEQQPKTNNTTQNSPQDQANKDSASAVGGLFQNAGIDDESTTQAATFLEPLAKGINIVCSFILGATSLGIFLITACDLLYIAFPPVRNMLNPQSSGGGGMGGYGGGGQQSSGIRWVSDEAMACAGGGSTGGGDAFGGGMGSPMGGGGSQGSSKSMVLSYLKKRTVFLIVFAICVILFTSTVFTDLGLRLGMLILGWITGVNGSIPI